MELGWRGCSAAKRLVAAVTVWERRACAVIVNEDAHTPCRIWTVVTHAHQVRAALCSVFVLLLADRTPHCDTYSYYGSSKSYSSHEGPVPSALGATQTVASRSCQGPVRSYGPVGSLCTGIWHTETQQGQRMWHTRDHGTRRGLITFMPRDRQSALGSRCWLQRSPPRRKAPSSRPEDNPLERPPLPPLHPWPRHLPRQIHPNRRHRRGVRRPRPPPSPTSSALALGANRRHHPRGPPPGFQCFVAS